MSINADERAMLDAIAAAWGVSRAAAIRRLIRESPVGKEQAKDAHSSPP